MLPINAKEKGPLSPTNMALSVNELLLASDTAYDTAHPIQRPYVWSRKNKVELIDSIIRGISINALHAVKKDDELNADKRWIVDGKQRLETLRSFYGGFLKVPVITDSGEKSLSFKKIEELAKKGDVHCKHFASKFLTTKVEVHGYDPMSEDMVRLLFTKINCGKTICRNHLDYTEHPVLTGFIKQIRNSPDFTKLLGICPKKFNDAKQTEDLAFIHRLLLVRFGRNLDEDFSGDRNLSGGGMSQSYQTMEIAISSMKDAKRQEKIDEVLRAISSFAHVCGMNPTLNGTKSMPPYWVFDCIALLLEGASQSTLTRAQVYESPSVCWGVFKGHLDWIDEKSLKRGSYNSDHIQIRFQNIRSLLGKSSLDIRPKNKGISPLARAKALGSAPLVDPVTGMPLNADNVQVDHLNAKSKFAETDFAAVTADTNRRMSNLTVSEMDKMKDFKVQSGYEAQ